MAPLIPIVAAAVIGGIVSKKAGGGGGGGNGLNQDVAAGQISDLSTTLGKSGTEAIGQATGFFGDILKGGQPLAEATGTTASDVGRQYKDILGDVNRNAPRGGAATRFTSELPYLQTSDVNRLRLGAKETAASSLASIGTAGTGQAMGGFEGLLRGALFNKQINRQFYGEIGRGIGSLLGGVFMGGK